MICLVIMTIRATQKKIISKPVTNTDDGRYCCNAILAASFSSSPVQSKVENGHNADEYQVSSTSSSRFRLPVYPSFAANDLASFSSCATYTFPSSLYQAGIW